MHTDKTPVPITHDNPQYLKGLGEPMPFHSHSEYMAAKRVSSEIAERHIWGTVSDSDAAELDHLGKRIRNYEKLMESKMDKPRYIFNRDNHEKQSR